MPSPRSPFDIALTAAKSLPQPAASRLYTELVQALAEAGRVEDALQVAEKIHSTKPLAFNRLDALLQLARAEAHRNRSKFLPRILREAVKLDDKAAATAVQVADILLGHGSIRTATDLLSEFGYPFETERARYDFLERLLDPGGVAAFEPARCLLETFQDVVYADWARLALAKRLLPHEPSEAETLAESFVLDRRRSWALYELSRLAPPSKAPELMLRALTIAEAIDFDPPEQAEPLAVQLRILGKAAYRAGCVEPAERVLERCEAVVEAIPVPMQRFRGRCFLGKVLRELGLVASVDDYLDREGMLAAVRSTADRSRLFQWLAEATGKLDDWNAAMDQATRELADAPTPTPLSEEFRGFDTARIIELAHRYAARSLRAEPSGYPPRDVVTLSAEDYETYYFSPFAVDDCGC